MERKHRGASERLLQDIHMNDAERGDWTLLVVEGEDWREYMLREPDWAQSLEGGLVPGVGGHIERHVPKTAAS